MDYTLEKNGCWRGRIDDAVLGSALDMSVLGDRGLTIRQLKQVHGTTILDDRLYLDAAQQADGLISDKERVALVVRSADCVPVYLAGEGRVAAIHAGWRGTRAGIVASALDYFDPLRLHAVLGPAIGVNNYMVDRDLYGPWLAEKPEYAPFFTSAGPGSKRLFDLKGLIRHQLILLGVAPARITVIPVCTYSSPLPSYRRQGSHAKRIVNYIYRKLAV